MTQAQLAKKCKDRGVPASDSQLSKIERGHCTPRPALRAALAEILELDVTKVGKA